MQAGGNQGKPKKGEMGIGGLGEMKKVKMKGGYSNASKTSFNGTCRDRSGRRNQRHIRADASRKNTTGDS